MGEICTAGLTKLGVEAYIDQINDRLALAFLFILHHVKNHREI